MCNLKRLASCDRCQATLKNQKMYTYNLKRASFIEQCKLKTVITDNYELLRVGDEEVIVSIKLKYLK
jgi:hypothetical protein